MGDLAVHNSVMKGKTMNGKTTEFDPSNIKYTSYRGELDLPLIMNLVDVELSEPYSIFTYRYFVHLWPNLTFLAFDDGRCVGTVVCKKEPHREKMRGYIAMLVVVESYRGKHIATELVTRAITEMSKSGCEEVALEAEVTNAGALALYGRLGFIRAKRLHRYYLNGVDAFRLKLLFPAKKGGETSDTSDNAAQSSTYGTDEASGTNENTGGVSTYIPVLSSATYGNAVSLISSDISDEAAQCPSGMSESSGTSDTATQMNSLD